MPEAVRAERWLSEIKVTAQPDGDGPGRVIMEWVDTAGARQRETYFGIFASQFAADLANATGHGEPARIAYLVGRIREVERLAAF